MAGWDSSGFLPDGVASSRQAPLCFTAERVHISNTRYPRVLIPFHHHAVKTAISITHPPI